MNLKLTPEQYLALYQKLSVHKDNDLFGRSPDPLDEVYDQMHTSLVEVLTNVEEKVTIKQSKVWLDAQQKRIDELEKNKEYYKEHQEILNDR